MDAVQCAPTEPVVAEDIFNGSVPITSVLARIYARRGQDRFREDLFQVWGGACTVTGLECPDVLRASHIKPWADSDDKKRLDRHNGILLSATIDALFGKGLITFDDSGQMEVSPRLDAKHRGALGLPKLLRFVSEGLTAYLSYHRDDVLKR